MKSGSFFLPHTQLNRVEKIGDSPYSSQIYLNWAAWVLIRLWAMAKPFDSLLIIKIWFKRKERRTRRSLKELKSLE